LRNRTRAALIAILTLVSAQLAVAPVGAVVAAQKVVIIVGPTGAQTANYRSKGDAIAAAATADGATVIKVYSPNATWSAVKAAVNGANIVIYLGHGNGFPNPYSSTAQRDRDNGWGLNRTTGGGDSDDWSKYMVYCGEKALRGALTSSDGAAQRTYCAGGPITPAPNWVMIYSNACYAPGASEGWDVPATQSVAFQRVRNYSYTGLSLGGGAYYATDMGAQGIVDDILQNPDKPFGAIAEDANGYDLLAQVHGDHPDVAGGRIWIQNTGAAGSGDYFFAFAGYMARTPSGLTVAYTEPVPPQVYTAGSVTRIGGPDRYAVSANTSATTFAPGVPVAYVAVGTKFPDALTAGPAAAHQGGPVLLTSTDSLPASVAAELARLAPQRIVVVGGAASVSDAVIAQLDAYTTGPVTRIGGADRYDVAAGISASTFASADTLYLANGANFPDALSGGPAAGFTDRPMLLTSTGSLPASIAAEISRLHPTHVYVLGGAASVSDAVIAQVQALLP
jgi:hypothetical protein